MEDLNKTQIILLTLLVSFVTSIGTGIITVSLLNQAPTQVTQTINRVVERTVEKVIPQSTGTNTVTKETTVVVNEEDLVIDSINKNAKSIARITSADGTTFISIGIVVSKEGTILAHAKSISPGALYSAVFSDGKTYSVRSLSNDQKTNIAVMKIEGDSKTKRDMPVATFANSDAVKLGQTVIAIGGTVENSVAIGRITGFQKEKGADGVVATSSPIAQIETDITGPKGETPGTPLINLNGEIVGMKIWTTDSPKEGEYVAINSLKSLIK